VKEERKEVVVSPSNEKEKEEKKGKEEKKEKEKEGKSISSLSTLLSLSHSGYLFLLLPSSNHLPLQRPPLAICS